VPVRSLYRRPHSRQRKRRKPWTVRSSRSVVDDEWQCGQFMAALLIAQNGGPRTYPLVALSASCPEI
jgi:hypothetical protein